MDQLLFKSLSSSSSGNCYYIGTHARGILIDAGIPVKQIRKILKSDGIGIHQIMGIVVTHDHADHIRGVGTLGVRFSIPVYTTQEVHQGMDRNYGMTQKLNLGDRRYIKVGEPFELAGLTITAFHVSHDSTDCNGYFIEYGDINILVATDVGCVDEVLRSYVRRANYLIIEANYNEHMLLHGPYPIYLQRRIISDTGHMDNEVCGKTLADCYHDGMKHIWLCHLSEDNNDPTLAKDTVVRALQAIGVDTEKLPIEPLPRTEPIPLVVLD